MQLCMYEISNCVHTLIWHSQGMLTQVATLLDAWVAKENAEARAEGLPIYKPCFIRVVGQMSLLLAGSPLVLAATKDVDVFANYEYAVETEFRRLLEARGLDLDRMANEIWMPSETQYVPLFEGVHVMLERADLESVLISKALKAPQKNHVVLLQYLARGASPRFLELAEKYDVDLEQFL